MLGTAKVVKAVAEFLSQRTGKNRLPNVVLDPILRVILWRGFTGCRWSEADDRKTDSFSRRDHAERG
jgi:hypothetical protein